MNSKLTKAGLIEAIKDYPDDAPIAIDPGGPMPKSEYAWLEDEKQNRPLVWAVSDNPNAIILEL